MRKRRSFNRTAIAMALLLAPVSIYGAARAGEQIRWRTGTVPTVAKTADEIRTALASLAADRGVRHVIVQFSEPVRRSNRETLEAAGVRLLSYLGDEAFFAVLSRSGIDVEAASRTRSLRDVRAVDPAYKLHPLLAAGAIPAWAVVGCEKGFTHQREKGLSHELSREVAQAEACGSEVIGAYILFHPDVVLEPTGVAAAHRHGAKVQAVLSSINGLVIELPLGNISALASEDVVQWIEPPLPRLSELNDSNRDITGANIVQDPPYGLDGSGVTVLVYDGGYAFASHEDFGGRLTVRDDSGLSDHATHVSGTVGGDGTVSEGLYRGMAPGVDIVSYGFDYDGSDIFLYSNPGDIETDYEEAINVYGADLSNSSIGTNTCRNGFPCEITGDYGVTSVLIDTIVTGGLSKPFRIFWANGNERSCANCPDQHQDGYHSTAPPACAKNHITVGALNSNDDSQTSFTSWGPCDDGRLKPDIAGPGCQSDDDGAVTSCSTTGGYRGKCGTSMSSPTVAGLGALILQDFRSQFPGKADLRNSTLKALLAHNADDLGNSGPDYQSGYGSVRVQPTIDFLRTGQFLEAQTDQGETYSALVSVLPGSGPLKVTIAWDDVPATPNVARALVNDLDLKVYDPSLVRYYPWTLGGLADPGAPAVRTRADHVNNIEQVFAQNPTPGVWRIDVHGFSVPQGPQVFSLCASSTLIDCSVRGVISLDQPKYACESTVRIQVVDCDLDADGGVPENVSITVVSSSEPAGEMVTLIETAPASATFEAAIDLSTTDAAGVLHVAAGDTITATYIDANDGSGGTDVEIAVSTVVDCAPPVVLNVQAIDVGVFGATVAFGTDEPARATVRYGPSCDSLSEVETGLGYQTTHDIRLRDLSENTAYFLAVDAVDEAANSTSDDNGGTCYVFVTPTTPNFFTERFSGDFDMDYRAVVFRPNTSSDGYAVCVEEITAFATDPIGGTVLELGDDDFAFVELDDSMMVRLYGIEYTGFYVGSNGYVTFGSGDTDMTETPAEHFEQPRVAGLYDDIDPEANGTVSFLQFADRIAVTWQDVPEWNRDNANTFQIELLFNGTIAVNHLSIDSDDSMVGLSAGEGVIPDFTEIDLSESGVCGPRPPLAESDIVSAVEDVPAEITLSASDIGLSGPAGLAYVIVTLTSDGILSDPGSGVIEAVPYELVNHGNTVLYTPAPGLTGLERFEFKANDGGEAPNGGDSNVAAIFILIAPDCNENLIADDDDIASFASKDCNVNGAPDECDIADGTSQDVDGNGLPDECTCAAAPGDSDGDGDIDLDDFAALTNCYNSPISSECFCADLDGDNAVNEVDLAAFVAGMTGP